MLKKKKPVLKMHKPKKAPKKKSEDIDPKDIPF